MEKLTLYFGLISCLCIGVFGQKNFVTVGEDIQLLPTPDPLIDPNDKVDVNLTCTGSRADLSFYIKNSVNWEYISPDGKKMAVSNTFYRAPNSEFADQQFNSGHMAISYGPNGDKYEFNLTIRGVTHSDNGIYRCSLLAENNSVTDFKDIKLTVLHPVDRLSIEIQNEAKETIAEKKTPITMGEANVELTPGRYNVKCVASGSNPAPSMSLFFNEERPAVSVKLDQDTSGNRVRNTGTFEKMITLNAHTVPQELMCHANIPGGHFPEKKAGLSMLVQVDKPHVVCNNVTTSMGSRYADIICNISAEGASNAGLLCEKVSWLLGNKNQVIAYDDTWKDPTQKFDIMKSECTAGENGLQVTLTIYLVKASHFVEMYYIVYGIGDNSHRWPIQLHEDTTAGVSGVAASLSLMTCVAMATVIKRLML